MTYTFKTFGPQPDGTYRYKVYNGPMVLRQGLCRNRKEAEVVARHYIANVSGIGDVAHSRSSIELLKFKI